MAYEKDGSIIKRQSYVQKSGEKWEVFVMNFCNKELDGTGIKIIRGKTIAKGSELWIELSIPVGAKKETNIWGDIDLVAVDEKDKPIAVISCKTSLHGRFSETLFYAVVLKDMTEELKVVFATSDKGRQAGGKPWSSEWGSEEKPTKDRLLGSHYLDGVYIHNKSTKLGGKVKALEELPKDLVKWRNELSKHN